MRLRKTKKRIKYTITGKNDGFGAQYQAILSGIALCEYEKYKYKCKYEPIILMFLESAEVE
ncbi:hypothetical protein LCGC14_2398300 [marine sediment metagenome]|uniref:Uncharacterized protein n=1 Tax=marine sediment metagenome TaxID=412755 RepID=A0A0F9BW77_9ZZZZ